MTAALRADNFSVQTSLGQSGARAQDTATASIARLPASVVTEGAAHATATAAGVDASSVENSDQRAETATWSTTENKPRKAAFAPPSFEITEPVRSHALQQWEGVVQDVGKEQFVASLRDIDNPDHAPEQATVAFDEVSDDDRPLVAPGAVFYWTIGYRVEPHGQKWLTSGIRFRRLPAWSKRDMKDLQNAARAFDDILS
jgi:hypothetical protein